jgi:hypothetical protein
LLLADFDPGVTAIAAQPFLLRAQAGGRLRRHVPDFLLVRADHTVQVVNVKPAARLADPAVAEALAWPGPLFEARGREPTATLIMAEREVVISPNWSVDASRLWLTRAFRDLPGAAPIVFHKSTFHRLDCDGA